MKRTETTTKRSRPQTAVAVKAIRMPAEIRSRLMDVDEDPDTASIERLLEEAEYVTDLLREGGSNYDDSPLAERRKLLRDCERFIRTHTKPDPRPMQQRLIKADGTVLGLSYSRASGRRGAVLMVSTTRPRHQTFCTALLVDGKDFGEAYDLAVKLIADYHEVPVDDPLRELMRASKAAFLRTKGLSVSRVVISYDQVSFIADNEPPVAG